MQSNADNTQDVLPDSGNSNAAQHADADNSHAVQVIHDGLHTVQPDDDSFRTGH